MKIIQFEIAFVANNGLTPGLKMMEFIFHCHPDIELNSFLKKIHVGYAPKWSGIVKQELVSINAHAIWEPKQIFQYLDNVLLCGSSMLLNVKTKH